MEQGPLILKGSGDNTTPLTISTSTRRKDNKVTYYGFTVPPELWPNAGRSVLWECPCDLRFAVLPLTLCRGAYPSSDFCAALAASSSSSGANRYIPVSISFNNGSTCAPLNLVSASAGFRLCGHHRNLPTVLFTNSSSTGTSNADFLSSLVKSLAKESNNPLLSVMNTLSGSRNWTF